MTGLACSGTPTSPSQQIVYRVSGAGTTTAGLITYEASRGTTAQVSDVALPWDATRTAQSGDFLYVSAQNGQDSGCITAEIRSGSRVLQTVTSCGAFVVAVASGVLP